MCKVINFSVSDWRRQNWAASFVSRLYIDRAWHARQAQTRCNVSVTQAAWLEILFFWISQTKIASLLFSPSLDCWIVFSFSLKNFFFRKLSRFIRFVLLLRFLFTLDAFPIIAILLLGVGTDKILQCDQKILRPPFKQTLKTLGNFFRVLFNPWALCFILT